MGGAKKLSKTEPHGAIRRSEVKEQRERDEAALRAVKEIEAKTSKDAVTIKAGSLTVRAKQDSIIMATCLRRQGEYPAPNVNQRKPQKKYKCQ